MPRRAPVAAVLTLVLGASFAAATAVGPAASASPAVPSAARSTTAAREAAAGNGPSWLLDHGRHVATASGAARTIAAAAAARSRTSTSSLAPDVVTQPAAADGAVTVTVTGSAATVASRVKAVGGRILAGTATSSVAVIPQRASGALAGARGISAVGTVNHPYADSTASGPSQAVAASGADTWQNSTPGITGVGVKLAIVDLGFGASKAQYDSEVAAGHLGSSPQLDPGDCVDSNTTTDPYVDDHGLAVAEIAHQQAPDTQLFLYCVNSPQGLSNAVTSIAAAGITIASSSLGWFEDARGDGTGDADSVATSVLRARRDGILWINSAGNEVPQHYSGALADVDKDGYLDLGNHDENTYPYESNFYTVAGGSSSAPADFAWIYQWDNWPTTSSRVSLEAYGVQCTSDFADNNGVDGCQATEIAPITKSSTAGDTPTVSIDLDEDGSPNTSQYPQIWEIQVRFLTAFTAGARYDLYGEGDAANASDLSCPTANPDGTCKFSAAATNGSVVSPANSPYALAVGAADVGADGETKGTLEYFSSQGPTIDGRTKPDITGWDGLSSYVYDDGFYGTSAAAPSVAGTAALVESADPTLDPAQVQNFLEQRANSGSPRNPPTNQLGHGLLTLGTPPAAGASLAPAGSQYAAQTPTRILDTRTSTGGHQAKLGAGGTVTVAVNVPTGATAVAINLTGATASATTYLTAYPGGTAAPNASNLNLSKVDSQAAVFAVVAVNANKTITIRNNLGTVDVIVDQLGYFGHDLAATDLYNPLSQPTRAIDTRTTATPIQPGTGTTVTPPNPPAGATAAVVNITVTNTTGVGYVNASATCSTVSSTVNLGTKITRANLAIVKLASDGSFCITDVGHRTDVVVDVVGYMGTQGSQYFPLPSTTRIVDTRSGNGLSAGGHASKALASKTSTGFYGANVGDVPASATALLTGVVEASATTTGYLELFPGTTAPASATSNLNFTRGQTVPNAAIVGVPANHIFGIYSDAGSTQAVVDVFGYFAPAPSQ